MEQLTIKYIIDLFNDHIVLDTKRKSLYVDSYQTINIGTIVNFNNLLITLLKATKDIKLKIIEDVIFTYDLSILEQEVKKIINMIYNLNIDITKKKKIISFITNKTNDMSIYEYIPNEIILILCYHFSTNIFIYNFDAQTSKCYYYDDKYDKDIQNIIIIEKKKTINSCYELIVDNNKYMFEYKHPVIQQLIQSAFIVGFEQNKTFEIMKNDYKLSEKINIKQNIKINGLPKSYDEIYKKYNYPDKNIYINV